MEIIIKTLLGKTGDDYGQYPELLLDVERTQLISAQEKIMLEYLRDTFAASGQFPTEDYFLAQFMEYQHPLQNAKELSLIDLKVHYYMLMDKRGKQIASREIMKIASEIPEKGFTDDHFEALRALHAMNQPMEMEETTYSLKNFRESYEIKKTQPTGLLTFVKSN